MSVAIRSEAWVISRPFLASALPRGSGDPGVLSKGVAAGRKSLGPRFRGGERKMGSGGASEIPLALLLLHAGRLVVVDDAALALGGGGEQHLLDDLRQRLGLALHRAGQRVAALGAEADLLHHRDLAGLQPHALVV